MEPLVVKQSRKGNFLYGIGAGIFSLLCLILFLGDFRPDYGYLARSDSAYFRAKCMLFIGVFFFGCVLIFICKRAKSGKVILIVDERGITDHSNACSFGFIPWEDIEWIYLDSILDNRFIEIEIKEQQKYLERLPVWKQEVVLKNQNLGHQMVCITLNSTGISPESLLPQILMRFEEAKRK